MRRKRIKPEEKYKHSILPTEKLKVRDTSHRRYSAGCLYVITFAILFLFSLLISTRTMMPFSNFYLFAGVLGITLIIGLLFDNVDVTFTAYVICTILLALFYIPNFYFTDKGIKRKIVAEEVYIYHHHYQNKTGATFRFLDSNEKTKQNFGISDDKLHKGDTYTLDIRCGIWGVKVVRHINADKPHE